MHKDFYVLFTNILKLTNSDFSIFPKGISTSKPHELQTQLQTFHLADDPLYTVGWVDRFGFLGGAVGSLPHVHTCSTLPSPELRI